MAELKQSTAFTRAFLMIQSADHITGLTGASPTLNLSQAGGAFQSTNAVIAEIGNGFYKASLTSTDTRTLGDLGFHFAAASADPTDFVDQIRANILGDTLPANVTQYNGSAVSVPATAGIPDVNVKNYNNQTAQSDASNLPKVDLENIKGSASAGAAGSVGIDWAQIVNKTSVVALTQTTLNSSMSVITSAPVTVGTNNDKTGYSLSQAFPSNFASLGILAGGQVGIDWGNVANKATANALSGTTLNSSMSVITSAPVTVGTNNDKTGYSLSQAFPSNFAALGILAGGQVGIDWGNVANKATVNNLSGTLVNSSASVLVTAPVTVGTNNDKTAYALTPQERGSIVASTWTTLQTEAVAALHSNPSMAQLLYELRAMYAEKSVSGTSVTTLQNDGATTLATYTLDSTSPTKISRAA